MSQKPAGIRDIVPNTEFCVSLSQHSSAQGQEASDEDQAIDRQVLRYRGPFCEEFLAERGFTPCAAPEGIIRTPISGKLWHELLRDNLTACE